MLWRPVLLSARLLVFSVVLILILTSDFLVVKFMMLFDLAWFTSLKPTKFPYVCEASRRHTSRRIMIEHRIRYLHLLMQLALN
jgi:hypothetical protein